MPSDRQLPWTDLVEAVGEPRLEEIRDALAAAKLDAFDRDAFLMNGAVGRLLREMMPEEAPAEAVTAYGALLHMLYLCWTGGWPVRAVGSDELRAALATALPLSHAPTLPRICYLQLPPHLVWAEPVGGEPHEPLDGLFVAVAPERLRVLAVLGLRPLRDGYTTMEGETSLPAPAPCPRSDGSPPFGSVLPGGELAHLISVVSQDELTALGLLALAAGAARR